VIRTARTSAAGRRPRNARLLASLALCTGVVLGATGCGLTADITTATPYSPSDGMNVPDSGPIDVRNALIVVNADDQPEVGSFVAALINSTDSSETLTIQIGEGADAITEEVTVEADSVLSFGTADEPPLQLQGITAEAGSTVAVFFQSGDAEGVRSNVPVLDGDMDYLSTLVPTHSPSSSD